MIYRNEPNETEEQEPEEENANLDNDCEMNQQEGESEKEQHEPKREQNQQELKSAVIVKKLSNETIIHYFFEKRTITAVVQPKMKRKFFPPYIAGSLLKKTKEQILKDSSKKALQKQMSKSSPKSQLKVKTTMKKNPKVTMKYLQMTKSQIEIKNVSSESSPGTSGTSKGGQASRSFPE